jgi:hypothetical protein
MVLEAMVGWLTAPDLDCAVEVEAAGEWREDRAAFEGRAREWTRRCALP